MWLDLKSGQTQLDVVKLLYSTSKRLISHSLKNNKGQQQIIHIRCPKKVQFYGSTGASPGLAMTIGIGLTRDFWSPLHLDVPKHHHTDSLQSPCLTITPARWNYCPASGPQSTTTGVGLKEQASEALCHWGAKPNCSLFECSVCHLLTERVRHTFYRRNTGSFEKGDSKRREKQLQLRVQRPAESNRSGLVAQPP
jgi:hypothetical protein